jgi:hypothetical protein
MDPPAIVGPFTRKEWANEVYKHLRLLQPPIFYLSEDKCKTVVEILIDQGDLRLFSEGTHKSATFYGEGRIRTFFIGSYSMACY